MTFVHTQVKECLLATHIHSISTREMTQTQEINKQKIKDVDIIKIDFILDLEI